MTKFSDLKLDPSVLKAIAAAGYEMPTPIQAGAIPPALEGRDVLGIAQTGTGKTASFVLPMITLLGRGRARARMPRSLVLCPTRELAAQVAENFDTYAQHTRLTKALLIGGVSFGEQDKLIDRGVDVLIATPGRLLDHFERGKLLLTGVQIMVVDEADRMLDMGFIPDIERIFQLTPFTRQTLFFSATMAPEIERITDTFLHAPERIEVARQATASETIAQKLVELAPTRRDLAAKQKRDLLRALIDAEGPETENGGLKNAIIFCNRKTDVDILAKSLAKHGYDAAPIHGDLDQSHRTRTLESFREGKLKFLIASDVAARGLDIPAVSHVFNYDLPSHAEDYVHRIGRTGRAGRLGSAFSIATPSDDKYLAAIENLVKQPLPRAPLPEGFTLSENDRNAGREERRPGRDKGRGRRREEDRREPREDRAPEPQREAPAAEERREPAREEKREARREDRRDHGRDRRGGRDDHHRGPAVVGMGDHVPEFMLVELRRALASVANDNGAIPEKPVEAASPAKAEASADKPRRSRNRRKRAEDRSESASPEAAAVEALGESAPQIAAVQPDAVEPAADVSPVDQPVIEPAAEDAPRPKRTRRKKAEPETDGAPAAEPAAKPKRTRRAKSDAAVEPAPDAVAEDAPKPKRTRRKKADEVPVAASQDSADA
ncbi:DEAD/DEAH box helicase [Paracoccus sediminis]|uniref:DEAD-box ATP-dependent RNA helicase RhpA n=1 Tax=Paracoccus sediminis TaxID=1214787 RepID=A0A238X4N8_9RHOB|nr:DEAD/DEAH box helicase [Paracoccus sediminis]SNR53985.1 Superfamily II DNA and RNA helicase [Paracoccus sediminis]